MSDSLQTPGKKRDNLKLGVWSLVSLQGTEHWILGNSSGPCWQGKQPISSRQRDPHTHPPSCASNSTAKSGSWCGETRKNRRCWWRNPNFPRSLSLLLLAQGIDGYPPSSVLISITPHTMRSSPRAATCPRPSWGAQGASPGRLPPPRSTAQSYRGSTYFSTHSLCLLPQWQ